ncbi:MAG: hypothetical protein PHN69_03375 [Candidatus Pacebacteria bacterium]|nr:hypothetical protein [Candidatus Paceibacterota bacterium]
MNNILTFLKTYWLHSRSLVELFIFIIGLIGIIWGKNINLSYQIGIIIVFISLIYASYEIWLYEHNRFIQYYDYLNDINDIQSNILQRLNKSEYKKIIVDKNLDSVSIRLGDSSYEPIKDYNDIHADELVSLIEDLFNKNFLSKELNTNNCPVYSLSKQGFDYLKLLINIKNK